EDATDQQHVSRAQGLVRIADGGITLDNLDRHKPSAAAVARATATFSGSSSISVALTSARRGCLGSTVRTSRPWPAHMLMTRIGPDGALSSSSASRRWTVLRR